MRFYDCSTAPSPRRTRIFFAEKGLEIETIQVDLATGEQLGDAFREINPRCTVPALQLDDGTVLSENLAIASYIEDTHPDPPLFGTSPVERAQVLEWNARVETEGLMAVAEVLRNSSKRMQNRALPGPLDVAQIPELAERGHARLAHFFEVLDHRLADREHLAIDTFSLADITAFVVVDFARWVKATPTPEQKNLAAWFDRVGSRPSVQA